MAHSLGGLLDLPHGHCNAILLPDVMDYNFDTVPHCYLKAGEAMGIHLQGMTQIQQKKAILEEVVRLQLDAGVSQRLGQIGTSRSDIPHLAEHAMNDACMVTNPRRPSRKDIEEIYVKAF